LPLIWLADDKELKMGNIKVLLFLGIFYICIVSCQASITDHSTTEKTAQITRQSAVDTIKALPPTMAVMITKTPVQIMTNQVFPTNTLNLLPTPSPTKASWINLTPNLILPLPTAKANVEELLKTNGGCVLPCWWGGEPARTSFATTFNQLSPFASFVAEKKIDNFGSLDAEFRFPVSDKNSRQEITVYYKVENEIIQLIEVYPGQDKHYSFNQFIKNYGEPEKVWVEGLIDPTSDNPFTIYFYYSQKGIITAFGAGAIDLGEKLEVCPGLISPFELVLWKPSGTEDFVDIATRTYGLAYIKKENRSLISLEQVTNQNLVEISESNCFQTPKKLWPVR
jgi:hypothetical protein